ncbi:MAG: hypothetical protein WD944_01425 [Steroidobacteraceae bacterium]
MAAIKDFRQFAFDPARVDAAGKNIAQNVYWKLYAIENSFRVIVHSILSVQINPNWWTVAVDPGIQGQIAKRKADYASAPWHSSPGKHDVYYAFLSDLSKIIAANSHLFKPDIPDIDAWVARIEQIRLPRNIVGHMNWPHATDRSRIDVFHADLQHLLIRLAASRTGLTIP